MKEFTLFLDESKPNNQNDYYCLAGFVVERETYETKFCQGLQNIKDNILHTSVPLHAYDMRKAKGDFSMMSKSDTRGQFYEEFKRLFNSLELTVLGTIINVNEYKRMYNSYSDVYSILFHALLENYVHFLINNNGEGNICMETRNIKEDQGIRREYYKLYLNGSFFYNEQDIQDHIKNVVFLEKSKNNLGLQCADFIPGYIVRHYNDNRDSFNLGKMFLSKAYDAKIGLSEQFGIRKVL